PQSGSMEPKPTHLGKNGGSEFPLRLIVHVDSTGKARLLKSVVQMWQDGTTKGDHTVDVPGHYVLVTDDALLTISATSKFKASTLIDGQKSARRISTPAYDGFAVCTGGDPAKLNTPCCVDSDCATTTGSCQKSGNTLRCTPDSPAHANAVCTTSDDCN